MSGPVCNPPCKLVVPPGGGGVICVCPDPIPVPTLGDDALWALGIALIAIAVWKLKGRKWN